MRPVELLLQYQKLGDRLSTLTDKRDHLESRLASDEASERALAILADQTESKPLARVIVEVRLDVERGSSLSQSMAKHPKVFQNLFDNAIAVRDVRVHTGQARECFQAGAMLEQPIKQRRPKPNDRRAGISRERLGERRTQR